MCHFTLSQLGTCPNAFSCVPSLTLPGSLSFPVSPICFPLPTCCHYGEDQPLLVSIVVPSLSWEASTQHSQGGVCQQEEHLLSWPYSEYFHSEPSPLMFHNCKGLPLLCAMLLTLLSTFSWSKSLRLLKVISP